MFVWTPLIGAAVVVAGWQIGARLGWWAMDRLIAKDDERKRQRENDARDITPR
jgi:hypothetical protein